MVHERWKPWVPRNRVRMEWIDSKAPYWDEDGRGRGTGGLDTCFNALLTVCTVIFYATFVFTSLWNRMVVVLM